MREVYFIHRTYSDSLAPYKFSLARKTPYKHNKSTIVLDPTSPSSKQLYEVDITRILPKILLKISRVS